VHESAKHDQLKSNIGPFCSLKNGEITLIFVLRDTPGPWQCHRYEQGFC